jgi:hypothetical protein
MLEAFAPSADQRQANFESLVLATMTAPTKSPVSPLMEIAPIARDRYVSLSSNAIGFVGHERAALQPVPVPIFRLFLAFERMTAPTKLPVSPLMEIAPTARDRYISVSSNAIGAYLPVARFRSIVLTIQIYFTKMCSMKHMALLEAFAPSADQLRANFESLVLATMTAPTRSPVSPLIEIAPTAHDQYV